VPRFSVSPDAAMHVNLVHLFEECVVSVGRCVCLSGKGCGQSVYRPRSRDEAHAALALLAAGKSASFCANYSPCFGELGHFKAIG
jgi:hypothetical protein